MTQSHLTSRELRHRERRQSSSKSPPRRRRQLNLNVTHSAAQHAPFLIQPGTQQSDSPPLGTIRHPPILPSLPPLPAVGIGSNSDLSFNSTPIPFRQPFLDSGIPGFSSLSSLPASASLARPIPPHPTIEPILAVGTRGQVHRPHFDLTHSPLSPPYQYPIITNPGREEFSSSRRHHRTHPVPVPVVSSPRETPTHPVSYAPVASHSLPHLPSPSMSAAAPSGQPAARTSIANLLTSSNSSEADRNLLSLSHLASTMVPASTASPTAHRRRRPSTYRAPGPTSNEQGPLAVSTLPDDQRRGAPMVTASPSSAAVARMSRTSSLNAPTLGVSRSTSKRLSRSKSGLSPSTARRVAIEAAVSSAPGSGPNTAPASPVPGSTDHRANLSGPFSSSGRQENPAILRSISQNPVAVDTVHGFSQTVASNNSRGGHVSQVRGSASPVYSTMPKAALEAVARNMSAQLARSLVPPDAMDVEPEHEYPEISSSSHDNRSGGIERQSSPLAGQIDPTQAGLGRGARPKTTPDAKRAQNRESAKRFRVAQKQRWKGMEDKLVDKDKEIAKLKKMLQELTSSRLETNSVPGSGPVPLSVQSVKLDSIVTAELDVYRILLGPRTDPVAGPSSNAPIASDIGSLYRVLVSQLDGNVFGIRYENKTNGAADGPEVGECLWGGVHPSDSAHLYSTVVHMDTMVKVSDGQPMVFSYRRRRATTSRSPHESDEITPASSTTDYIRLKGCLYHLTNGDDENVIGVLLAEFVELSP